MYCEYCGFPIDERNDSQPICSRCSSLPADTHLNPAEIDCMVEDALAATRTKERESQVLEFECEQADTHALGMLNNMMIRPS